VRARISTQQATADEFTTEGVSAGTPKPVMQYAQQVSSLKFNITG
jgi:hypothetical protein